jgi:UDP-3-O-[3-hydroxymyristoyl] glucosamine N-acyltransferase
MEISLKEAASFIGGKITGDSDVSFSSLAKIDEAVSGDLTFLYLPAYEKFFPSTKATAILVKPGFEKSRDDITYVEVEDPNKAFFKILKKYFTPDFPLQGIEPSAFIHPSAVVSESAAIGRNVVISAGCKVGDNTRIFHNSVLLENSTLGDDCLLFQNVSIREGSVIGSRVIIHPGTVIGSDGFGYFPDENGAYIKIPQIGIVIVEDDVEIGSNVSIDRASLGATVIKKGVKIDNLVQIAHNVVVGENTVISAQSGISGSAHIGKSCIVAGQVGIVGHIEITDNVIMMAQSGISKSISKPGYYFGSPAKEFKSAQKIEAHIRNLPNYSEELKKLRKEIEEIKTELKKK